MPRAKRKAQFLPTRTKLEDGEISQPTMTRKGASPYSRKGRKASKRVKITQPLLPPKDASKAVKNVSENDGQKEDIKYVSILSTGSLTDMLRRLTKLLTRLRAEVKKVVKQAKENEG